MNKSDSKVVDIFKQIPITRENLSNETTDIPSNAPRQVPASSSIVIIGSLPKKKLNIPICDVVIDDEYENNLLANFTISSSYARYARKIGDDTDYTIDYNFEEEDEVWLQNMHASDKESKKILTKETFEIIIDILEKHTGFLKDPIPQNHAQKLIVDKLEWDINVTTKVISELYKFWLSKRERLGKPICRRYWPAITSSDSNPYQVFRTRDREKYRLRKQQKRNDVDAFRKMQQLRKEFSKAKSIMQLIVEREMLREAEFDIQREIFDETVYSMDPNNNIPRKSTPFRHKLTCEHLISPICTEIKSENNKGLSSSGINISNDFIAEPVEVVGVSTAGVIMTQNGNNKNATVNSKGKVINDDNATVKKKISSAEYRRRKKEREKDRLVLYTVQNGVTVQLDPVNNTNNQFNSINNNNNNNNKNGKNNSKNKLLNGFNTSSTSEIFVENGLNGNINPIHENGVVVDHNNLVSEFKLIHPDLDGPSTLCQPAWPSFMDDLPMREKINVRASLMDYIEDLEAPYEYDQVNSPVKYRCRSRIGRGGRLVMDRIAVYDQKVDESIVDEETQNYHNNNNNNNNNSIDYIYPTSLNQNNSYKTNGIHNNSNNSNNNGNSSNIINKMSNKVSLSNKQLVTHAVPNESLLNIISHSTIDKNINNNINNINNFTPAVLPEIALSNNSISLMKQQAKSNNHNNSNNHKNHNKTNTIVNNNSNNTTNSINPYKGLVSLPVMIPPCRPKISQHQKNKELEIYNKSDSEDEKVFIKKNVNIKEKSLG
eukprot:gene4496-6352_t